MSEPTIQIHDSTLAVTLTVGQLRELVREEIRAANTPTNEPLLTIEELARQLQCPTSYLYELSRLGKLPRYKSGKRYVYRLSEVLPVLKVSVPSS